MTMMQRNRNVHTLLVGMYIGSATVENSMDVPPKVKNRTTILSSNSTPVYLSVENGNTILKRYMHPSVHRNIIYSGQDMEAT